MLCRQLTRSALAFIATAAVFGLLSALSATRPSPRPASAEPAPESAATARVAARPAKPRTAPQWPSDGPQTPADPAAPDGSDQDQGERPALPPLELAA